MSISGGTITTGSGAVTLNAAGVSITSGTGTVNSISWTDGSFLYSATGDLQGSGSTSATLSGGGYALRVAASGVLINAFSGGGTQYVCVANTGILFASASAC